MQSIDPVSRWILLLFTCYIAGCGTMVFYGGERWIEFMQMTFAPVLVLTTLAVAFEMSRRG